MAMMLRDDLRHTGIGFLLGLIGVLFGLAWVVYITANHEAIHNRLSLSQRAPVQVESVTGAPQGAPSAKGRAHADGHAHTHADHAGNAAVPAGPGAGYGGAAAVGGAHTNPEMEVAHERLAKAHAHAMGLGILTIAVSVLLTLLPSSPRAKKVAAACMGTGGLLYPLSWIVMGMRTTSLGVSGSEASVVPLIGLSVGLVGLGLLLTLIYVVSWLFKKA